MGGVCVYIPMGQVTTSRYARVCGAVASYYRERRNALLAPQAMPEPKPKITPRQRRALELWLRQVSDVLNDAGYSVNLVLKEKMDVDWNHDLAKALLWKPAQKAILSKASTTQLAKTGDIDAVYDHLCRHLGERFGVEVPPWPHFEENEFEKVTAQA